MWTRHDPSTVCSPFSRYTNALEVDRPARWLHVSGQVGVDPAGETQDGFDAQCRTVFANIVALLADAGMDLTNLVHLRVFLTRSTDLGAYRLIRDEVVTSVVASSLIVVAGLAKPEWLVEIEAVAAAPL